MLSIQLNNPPKEKFNSYQAAITHLASNTVAMYRGMELRLQGPGKPSFDISQVCCWVSGQPLTNGMRLCTSGNGNGNGNGNREVAIIEEPPGPTTASATPEPMKIGVGSTTSISAKIEMVEPSDLLLVSDDCYEGLKMSLEEITKTGQTLIKDPGNPKKNARNPSLYTNYIWPNRLYKYHNSSVTSNSTQNSSSRFPYTSGNCFIYTKKTALVQHMVDETDGGSASAGTLTKASATLEPFIFVEPNPSLPNPLYVMAQNTIRLFRLNGRYYQYTGDDYHRIAYNASKNETPYDDLRRTGRMEAWKRARKSLDQLKTLRDLYPVPKTIREFIHQYRILAELTGYPAVWATVFNDGGDPGGLSDILGVPAPVSPAPVSTGPTARRQIIRSNIVNLSNPEAAVLTISDKLNGGVNQRFLVKKLRSINGNGNFKPMKHTKSYHEANNTGRKRIREGIKNSLKSTGPEIERQMDNITGQMTFVRPIKAH